MLARILASDAFHKSSRSRQLLEYLSQHHFSGSGEAIHESRIGTELFARGEDFDPSVDSIVRASMRQLRQRLAEYYETEGVGEDLVLQVPKGEYRLQFELRPQMAANASNSPEVEDSSPAIAVAPLMEVNIANQGMLWRRVRQTILRYGLVVLAAGAFFLGSWWERLSFQVEPMTSASAMEPQHSIFEHFLESTKGPVHFVPSDSIVNIMQTFLNKPVGLEEYRSRRAFALDHPAARENPEQWRAIVTRELLNIGDASLTLRAARDYPEHARRLSFRQSRDLQARDLRAGNYVFLGSITANPWVTIFEPGLNFQFRRYQPGIQRRWKNGAPRAGESPWYPPLDKPVQTGPSESYAHVAMIGNLSHSGRVLLVGGVTQPDTEAAGEFVLAPGSATTLAEALGVPDISHAPGFEVILRTEQTGNTWRVAEVVAHRLHETQISYVREPLERAKTQR